MPKLVGWLVAGLYVRAFFTIPTLANVFGTLKLRRYVLPFLKGKQNTAGWLQLDVSLRRSRPAETRMVFFGAARTSKMNGGDDQKLPKSTYGREAARQNRITKTKGHGSQIFRIPHARTLSQTATEPDIMSPDCLMTAKKTIATILANLQIALIRCLRRRDGGGDGIY